MSVNFSVNQSFRVVDKHALNPYFHNQCFAVIFLLLKYSCENISYIQNPFYDSFYQAEKKGNFFLI